MENNEILRSMQTVFNYSDTDLIIIFKLVDYEVRSEKLLQWLQVDEANDNKAMSDIELSIFLNGLIIEKRGPKDGPSPTPNDVLTNNHIFKKLRIALNLTEENLLEIFEKVEEPMDKNQLTSYFRRESHKNYRECENETLRCFLEGIQQYEL